MGCGPTKETDKDKKTKKQEPRQSETKSCLTTHFNNVIILLIYS